MVHSRTFAISDKDYDAVIKASNELKVSYSEVIRMLIHQAMVRHPEMFGSSKEGLKKKGATK